MRRGRIRTTWGKDGDIYAREARTADAMITYRFPHQSLAQDAPNLTACCRSWARAWIILLPLDWVPRGGDGADQ